MNYFLHLWISRICSRFVAQKTKYQPRWSRWACLESVIFGRFIIVWLKTGDHMLMVYRCFNVSHIFSPLKVQVLRVPHIFAQIQIPHVVVHIPVYPIYVLFKSQSLVDFLSSLCHYINSYSPLWTQCWVYLLYLTTWILRGLITSPFLLIWYHRLTWKCSAKAMLKNVRRCPRLDPQGLDATTALDIIRSVKRLTAIGMTVDPADVFFAFQHGEQNSNHLGLKVIWPTHIVIYNGV